MFQLCQEEDGTNNCLNKLLKNYSSESLVQARDAHGSTLLHYAAGCGQIQLARYLLSISCSIQDVSSTNTGRSALHWAARNGHTDICRLFLIQSQESSSDPDVLAKGQVTPLQLAVWQGHLETCQCLVQEFGANPHFINDWGCSVAHWLGKCPIYHENSRTSTDQEEATSESSRHHLYRMCDWLFEDCQVPYNKANFYGQTPIHKAAYAGNIPILECLVNTYGLLDTVRDQQGNSAADCAERGQQYEAARWIRRHASPFLSQALDQLGLKWDVRTMNLPSVVEIRGQFKRLAKVFHPDRQQPQSPQSSSSNRWNGICTAYTLIMAWWNDPEFYDILIRLQSRNEALREHLRLKWTDEWHESISQHVQKHRTSSSTSEMRNNSGKLKKQKAKRQRRPLSDTQMQELEAFETKLIAMVQSFPNQSLPLSQLPKEFEKNWRQSIPTPRNYACRTLRFLIESYCPNICVEFCDEMSRSSDSTTQVPVLRLLS